RNSNESTAPRRFFSGLAIAACAAAIWIALYPEILAGPMGQIDPLVRSELSPRTMEFMSATSNFTMFILTNYLGSLGVAAVCTLLWCDRRSSSRLPWFVLAALMTPLFYLGISHIRFSPYSCVVAAFPIAALLERLQDRFKERQSSFASYLRPAAL